MPLNKEARLNLTYTHNYTQIKIAIVFQSFVVKYIYISTTPLGQDTTQGQFLSGV